MNERDVSRRNEERQRQRQSEHGMGSRAEYGQHGVRRWGAGEDWDDTSYGRTQGRYAGDYETSQSQRGLSERGSSERGPSERMGRQYGGLGRDEQDWSQGRRESQRWGEQGTYGAQGSNEFERYGSDYGREGDYGGQFGDRRGEYAYGRDYASQGGGQGYGSQSYGGDYGQGRNRGYGSQDYGSQRGSGTQAYGQGEQSFGTHGYGSGREFRGYEGGESGRRAGSRHWERGYGEGYGLSSGYADEQAYDQRYGASGYATGYGSSASEGRPQGRGYASGRGDYGRSYRGMGPKSYTRSDERLLEDINERLTEDDYLDASDINVRCVNGVITLEGTVAERWMKHRAEDLADASSGVKQVDNRIQVQSQSKRAAGEQRMGEPSGAQGRSKQAGASTGTAGTSTRSGDNTPGTSSQH